MLSFVGGRAAAELRRSEGGHACSDRKEGLRRSCQVPTDRGSQPPPQVPDAPGWRENQSPCPRCRVNALLRAKSRASEDGPQHAREGEARPAERELAEESGTRRARLKACPQADWLGHPNGQAQPVPVTPPWWSRRSCRAPPWSRGRSDAPDPPGAARSRGRPPAGRH